MTTGSIMVRQSDGKRYTVTLYSHWSDLTALDGTETVSVKWLGGDQYIGRDGGIYTEEKERPDG